MNVLNKKIFIFGAGYFGEKYTTALEHYNLLSGFVDNSPQKQGILYCGKKVFSLDEYLRSIKDETTLIVIGVKKDVEKIANQLNHCSLRKDYDYFIYEDFEKRLRTDLFEQKNEIYLPTSQICLTERCTLKCKKCAHGCNLVPVGYPDLSLKVACQSADYFFDFVNYVQEFVLLGGEPFLYKNLLEVICYIGGKYRKNIGIFSITTNGTIEPADDILDVCQKYDVLMRISDYSQTIPSLTKRYKTLIKKLEQCNIKYKASNPNDSWMDYGFEYVDRHAKADELRKIFKKCWTGCHEIRDNKFYFCVMARSVSENIKNGEVGKEDFLNLSLLDGTDGRVKFFNYAMGNFEKGYLDMCNYCHGAEAENYPIPVAEQMKI